VGKYINFEGINSMQAQSVLTTHALLVLFMTLILIAVVNTTNSITRRYEEFVENQTTSEICSLIKSTIAEFESAISKESGFKRLKKEQVGEVYLLLPEKLGEKSYMISLVNSSTIFSIQGGKEISCQIETKASLKGRCSGHCKLVFYANESSTEVVLSRG